MSGRRNIEAECLQAFESVVDELGMEIAGRGCSDTNRFDAGFDLVGQQRFQFGDLRVMLDDRIVVVEVESGGGLTNLVKYWPLAEKSVLPILLLHAFRQSSANDYLSHLLLWDFTWAKMRSELWRQDEPRLFARRYAYSHSDPAGLKESAEHFRICLTDPLPEVMTSIFQFSGTGPDHI